MGKPGAIISSCESTDHVTVTIKKTSLRYLNEFTRLQCAPDLLAWCVFPNAKEITESFAAYQAVRKMFKEFSNPDVRVHVVGDGHSPRTGAVFAARSAWEVHSIDPLLRIEKASFSRIDRLHLHKEKVQDYTPEPFEGVDIVVAVHSHAPFGDLWHRLEGPKLGIAMPCCVPQNTGYEPDHTYEDYGIHSPHRTILVWNELEDSHDPDTKKPTEA